IPASSSDANELTKPASIDDATNASAGAEPAATANIVAITDQPPTTPQQPTRTLTLDPVTGNSSIDSKPPTNAISPVSRVSSTVPTESSKASSGVAAQLSFRFQEIDLPATSLGKFVDMLSQASAVPIKLDPTALAAAGVSPRTKITVHEQNA